MVADSDEVVPSVGDLVGHWFEVKEVCGHGGFGVGLLCADQRLPGRYVLVKWAKRNTQQDRFVEQARFELSLSSPFIRRTFELNRCPRYNRVFIVHEYVAGSTLDNWSPGKTLAERLTRFGHVLGAAISFASSKINFGDFHGGNIIVAPERTVVIDIDPATFGSHRAHAGAETSTDPLVTLYAELFTEEERIDAQRITEHLNHRDYKACLAFVQQAAHRAQLTQADPSPLLREAFVKAVGDRVALLNRYLNKRHAVIEDLFAMVSEAFGRVFHRDIVAKRYSPGDLSNYWANERQSIQSRSCSLSTVSSSIELSDGRTFGVFVEGTGASTFLPPWPVDLVRDGALLRGEFVAGDRHRTTKRWQLMATLPERDTDVPIVYTSDADGSRTSCDQAWVVARIAEILTP